jgi:hypothetical protein
MIMIDYLKYQGIKNPSSKTRRGYCKDTTRASSQGKAVCLTVLRTSVSKENLINGD